MKRSFILMSLAALVVVLLDQITKLWISSTMQLGQTTDVIQGFARLRYTHNSGAAFGIFADSTGILSIISMLVIIAIFVTFVRLGNPTWLSVLAAGLVIGGALGNLLDRVRLAYVVDFIETYGVHVTINNTLYTFPVFNVADSAITVGVILVLIGMLFGQQGEVTAPKTGTTPTTGMVDNLAASPKPGEQETEAKNANLAER